MTVSEACVWCSANFDMLKDVLFEIDLVPIKKQAVVIVP